MLSNLLTETKKSPVMNYEATNYKNIIDIYLLFSKLLEGKAENNLYFPGFCVKIMIPSASYLCCPSR